MSSAVSVIVDRQDRSTEADPVRESLARFVLRVLNEEVETYIQRHADARDDAGHALVTRNGRGATRTLHLDDGSLSLRAPRINDRRVGADGRRVRYASSFLRPYVRRNSLLSKTLPEQYRAGLESGSFTALLGTVTVLCGEALAADSLTRLVSFLEREHTAYSRFAKRD